MSTATPQREAVRTEQAAVRPASPTPIVVAGLVLALFVAIASAAQTAALLIPGVVFFLAFVATDLVGTPRERSTAS